MNAHLVEARFPDFGAFLHGGQPRGPHNHEQRKEEFFFIFLFNKKKKKKYSELGILFFFKLI